MTVRVVLQHPDPRLRIVAHRVEVITEDILLLVDDLIHTMRHGNRDAVGLAAPQLGAPFRVFVMEGRLGGGRPKIYACINPEITSRVGKTGFSEGCLSFPEKTFVRTERAERVTLSWTDRQGHRHVKELTGLLSVCAQHELDHLDGKLMVDHGELQVLKSPADV